MKLLRSAALAALFFSTFAAAQNRPIPNQTPAPSAGSYVAQQLVLANPSGACTTANQTTLNALTGDVYGCINSQWQALNVSGPYVSTVNGNSGAVTLTSANLISAYTWATGASQIPACTSALNEVIYQVSDIGDYGSYWACLSSNHDSARRWVPVNGKVMLAVSAVPFMIPSSGTIGNNGALTLTTALPRTYASGAYLYFPSGAISTGSAAGFYWTVMSSTTAGTIYNNAYVSPGLPAAPGTPTAFSTTGPGAYTQSTAMVTLGAINIPANLVGTRGELRMTQAWKSSATTNAKTGGVNWSGNDSTFQVASSSNTAWQEMYIFRSEESAFAQEMFNGWNAFGSGGNVSQFAVNTTTATTFGAEAQLAVATDFMILEAWDVELVCP